MNEIMNIQGIPCYEKDGVAYLNLETVARGLGFTKKADSGNEVVNWTRVRGYLTDLGVEQKCTTGDYIPENIFYRLAMKAKNETAERFQAMIADEVVPAIRKTGGYIAGEAQMPDEELLARALTMASEKLKQRDARIAELAVQNSELTVQKQIMQPKADYFDELVDRNLLTNFRETAKEMKIKELLAKDTLSAEEIRVLQDFQHTIYPTMMEILPGKTTAEKEAEMLKMSYDEIVDKVLEHGN